MIILVIDQAIGIFYKNSTCLMAMFQKPGRVLFMTAFTAGRRAVDIVFSEHLRLNSTDALAFALPRHQSLFCHAHENINAVSDDTD